MSREYLLALAFSLFVSFVLSRLRSRKPEPETEPEPEQGLELEPAAPGAFHRRAAGARNELSAIAAPRGDRERTPPSAPPRELRVYSPGARPSGIVPRDARGLRRALLVSAVLGPARALEPYDG